MFDQHMVLQVAPLAQFRLANRAQISMLILSMVLHVQESIALEIANLALEFDDARVDTLMGGDL